jgi:hypothetical protein
MLLDSSITKLTSIPVFGVMLAAELIFFHYGHPYLQREQ